MERVLSSTDAKSPAVDPCTPGPDNTVGLRSDGTVVAKGRDHHGQCKVSGWTDIVAVSAGDDFTVGLRSDGTVAAAGSNVAGEGNVWRWTDIRIL